MGSLGFFIDFSATLWSWGWLILQQKWKSGLSPRGKGGWQPCHIHVPFVYKFWQPQPLGAARACPGLYRVCFTSSTKIRWTLSIFGMWYISSRYVTFTHVLNAPLQMDTILSFSRQMGHAHIEIHLKSCMLEVTNPWVCESWIGYIICCITEYTNIPNSWAKLQEKYVKGLE